MSDQLWIPMFPGVRRQTIVAGTQMMQILVQLDVDARVPTHQHSHEQSSYLLSGRLRFRLAEQEHLLGPGDILHIPSGITHSVDVIEAALVIDTFAPPREDLLALDREQARA